MTSVDQVELRGAPEPTSRYNLPDLDDLGDITGLTVAGRFDIDLPSNSHPNPNGDLRYENLIGDIGELFRKGVGQVRAMGHASKDDKPVSTEFLVARIAERTGKKVVFVPDILDTDYIASLSDYEILVYENVRLVHSQWNPTSLLG